MFLRLFPTAVLGLALALTASACDSTTEESRIGGTYSGVTEDLGTSRTTATFDIPETESGESFTFEATIREEGAGDDDVSEFAGTGTYDHPRVTFTVGGETTPGTVSDSGDAITLTLEEDGDTAVLRRQ